MIYPRIATFSRRPLIVVSGRGWVIDVLWSARLYNAYEYSSSSEATVVDLVCGKQDAICLYIDNGIGTLLFIECVVCQGVALNHVHQYKWRTFGNFLGKE